MKNIAKLASVCKLWQIVNFDNFDSFSLKSFPHYRTKLELSRKNQKKNFCHDKFLLGLLYRH